MKKWCFIRFNGIRYVYKAVTLRQNYRALCYVNMILQIATANEYFK